MIFSGDLADKVLAGTKTQTRRPITVDGAGVIPCRYIVGKTYAVQRKRGTHGLGARIRILTVEPVLVIPISEPDARAEGFGSAQAFADRWFELYGRVSGRCWRITFELAGADS